MDTKPLLGLLVIAGGIAGTVFGVVDPGTGVMLVSTGIGMLGTTPKPIDLKGIEK